MKFGIYTHRTKAASRDKAWNHFKKGNFITKPGIERLLFLAVAFEPTTVDNKNFMLQPKEGWWKWAYISIDEPGPINRILWKNFRSQIFGSPISEVHFRKSIFGSPFRKSIFGSPIFGSPFSEVYFRKSNFRKSIFGSLIFGSPIFGSPNFGSVNFGSQISRSQISRSQISRSQISRSQISRSTLLTEFHFWEMIFPANCPHIRDLDLQIGLRK